MTQSREFIAPTELASIDCRLSLPVSRTFAERKLTIKSGTGRFATEAISVASEVDPDSVNLKRC